MNRALRFLLRAAAFALCLDLAGPWALVPLPFSTVVLLSMDGVRWDYPARDHLETFQTMARAGWSARHLTPPFPSLTFPSHATLATGVGPSKHGIVANSFLDRDGDRRFADEPEAAWLKAPPLWVLAERAGIKAAVCAWPCSRGAWGGVRPTYYRAYSQDTTDRETEAWILELLRKPAAERPGLVMAWTHGADGPAHAQGPDSEDVRRTMKAADSLLAELRAGLSPLRGAFPLDLIVVSDHGMAPVDHTVDVVKAVPKEGFYPFIATSGPLCNIYCKTEIQRRSVAAGLHRLPSEVLSMTRAEAARRSGYDGGGRTGDFVLLCPPGATFSSFSRKRDRSLPRGMHGYDPAVPDMGGIFLAEGFDFPPGKVLAQVRAVDLAPTLCACLRIPPPPGAEGANLLAGR